MNKLDRSLKFKDVLILAFSTMIGWGWVALTGSWISQGGALGASFAFLIGAVLCIFVGLVYSELTPMLPYAGGELVFSYKALGYHASWFTGWMITFAYIGVAAWEGPALATAVDYILQIPRYGYLWTIAGFDVYLTWLIIPAIVGGLLTIVNLKGIKVSSVFQAAVTLILALGGISIAIASFLNGDIENMQPIFTTKTGLFSVVLAVPAMFVGFDVIPQAAEEMKLPLKKIPKAIIASICLAAFWYIVVILSSSLSAPSNIMSGDGLSVVNAVVYATKSTFFGKIIVITAIMGILSSWNGFIIGATRVMYSMGRARMLPSLFGMVGKKSKSPIAAIIFVGFITVFTPLLGKNSLLWFVDASAFGTVIAYFMVSISFIVLRIKFPKLDRPYKLKCGAVIGVLAAIISVFFIILYLPVGSSSLSIEEWIIVAIWIILGFCLYLPGLSKKKDNLALREKAMYGKD